jgi:hypothetical protein
MAGGGRTYYATGTGRFSTGKEIRADAAALKTATRKGELKVLTSFGTTQENPKGSMSKEELLEVLRSGDTVKFGDGTSEKINAANKLAVINRLVAEGQRQMTPVPASNQPKIGGQFRGQPTQAAKPAVPAKPAQPVKQTQRGQPKPAAKPSAKPAAKPSAKPAQKGGKGSKGGKGRSSKGGKPTGSKKPAGSRGKPTPSKGSKAPKGGKTGGKEKSSKGGRSGSQKGKGFISSAGVTQIGNRRKGGGGKKDRAARRRKGGRSKKGRSR